jgi:hypothetical protein
MMYPIKPLPLEVKDFVGYIYIMLSNIVKLPGCHKTRST